MRKAGAQRTPGRGEVKYLVLADRAVPYLLARVRWPDVYQAISAASPDWLDDPGLFDLPYDPGAVTVSLPQAASVAAGWGKRLSAEPVVDAPSYLRRMPANWSDLSPSEQRTWGIEFIGRRRAPVRSIRRAGAVQAESNDAVKTERRDRVRLPLGGHVHIRHGDATVSAGLVDVGERGVQCVLPRATSRVAPGASLEGAFLLEAEVAASRICLDVGGQVRWRRRTRSGTHFGISFGELAESELDGVQRFLAFADGKRARR
ncbi:MAG: PilZ domain-containing protein [Thermoleophilaceae bacterium]|nr:PilZ domain-containing protein [Thermoleophilaceae bacterium]